MSSRLLKVGSLATLTIQNSLLTVLLHYSRSNTAPNEMFSAASAVLLTELLKLGVSIFVATYNIVHASSPAYARVSAEEDAEATVGAAYVLGEEEDEDRIHEALGSMWDEVFSSDCWKLAVPASLYVLQNNLQFVAASNLDVPTFQVTYNLKVLTTALFSVIMLKRRLSTKKWFALTLLAVGVGVVQLQSSSASATHAGSAMNRTKGLSAVILACVTSAVAGVFFELVLKGSKTDLWIRNIQLSLFSLVPALLPVVLPRLSYALSTSASVTKPPAVFAFFGFWAVAVVCTQVIGGLVTALVIKYADNLLKGFATSLAIVLSSLASIILFNFRITPAFIVGTALVISATVLYAQGDPARSLSSQPPSRRGSVYVTDDKSVNYGSSSSSMSAAGPQRRMSTAMGTTDLPSVTFSRFDSQAVQVPTALLERERVHRSTSLGFVTGAHGVGGLLTVPVH